MPGDHINGYKTATLNPWEFQHSGRATVKQKEDYLVIARPWVCMVRLHSNPLWITG